ncbi:serine/threonine-protein kinase [Ktedonobacter sp. SOSP1-85]|uniref:serine/threonine protein kinase n=1 Tax=Ktedonobacter sp. SOSP1-85 TaxID=2778367 RepID=UPI00191683C5|nr:serine/threonine-protein kinase [Ktedonobacter sp. SOSP1-85]
MQTKFPKGKVVRDRYEIQELLGTGGFGAVYRVRDRRGGNVYALKEQIDPNPQQRERFAFESRILEHLDHYALPRVYRVFEDEKAQSVYMLMDFINGPNLERLRRRQPEGRFTLARVMAMMKPIIEAVSYLHHQQPPIIHRDIKPSNMIIPTSGEGAVLVDFGIAKTYDLDSTTSAVRHCSPGYGSPEHYMRGTNLRSDIYGLGATFYTLLTGEVPIDALTRLTRVGSGSADSLIPAHSLVEELPQEVSDILQKAMALDPEDRYGSVEEFWNALKVYAPEVKTEPVVYEMLPEANETPGPQVEAAQPPPVTPAPLPPPSVVVQELPRRQRRSRKGLFLLVAALLLAFLLVGGLIWTANSGLLAGLSTQAKVTPTSSTVHQPTARATQAPTRGTTPTATPTSTPTAPPAPPVVQPPASPPRLAQGYSGTISDKYTDPPTNSTIALSNIAQNGQSFTGYASFGPGLVGNNNFNGTITPDRKFHFLVASYAGLLPLYFQGQVNGDKSLSGTYCSYRNNGCDNQSGGYGDWHASPR